MIQNTDQESLSLGVTSHATLQRQRFDYQLKLLELTELLHRKLELDLLIEAFFVELQTHVKFDGLEYRQSEVSETLLVGSQRQFAHKAIILLGEQNLGQLNFYRSQRFTAREDRELDRLCEHITYPLRNALEYRAAIERTLVDELTGMHNLTALDRYLPREILMARRTETPLSVMMLDIDHFRAVNQHHGDSIGDDALKAVASKLANTIRKSDMIFRYDVDSFVIVLSGTEYAGAKVLAERLRIAVDTCFQYDNVQVMLSASAGITEIDDKDDADSVLERAAEALLIAKNSGRNTLRALDREVSTISLV